MSSRSAKQIVAMFFLTMFTMFAALPQRIALAIGDQYGASEDDIQISVDYRWAGGSVGGYYPIRIGLQNRGPSRELEISFQPLSGTRLPVVSRRISIDQNASARLTLLIPLVGDGNYGNLSVSHDGRELKKLQNTFSLPDVDYENARPALLAISKTPVPMQPLEDAITSLSNAGHTLSSYGYGSRTTQDNQTIEPFRLPESWLAYSSVDLVSVSLDVLEELPETQRSAMLDWVRTGGTLLVYSVGEPVHRSRKLTQLTETDAQSAAINWQAAESKLRTAIREVQLDENGNLKELTAEVVEAGNVNFTWPADESPFEIRALGHGRLIGFVDNPFTGTLQDWGWLLKSFPFRVLWQTRRLGVAGRMDNAEFLEFLIAGIRSVPVLAFLVFISLFTFVIGPLNYFVLARKKKLNYLVITIPAIAIVTSLCLFGYSVLSHGFSVKSRVRSLTMIDQGNRKAVTTTRLALYAGTTPSTGLSFSPATAVIPIRASGEVFESARTDWTDTQWLRSGWLRSRTRTQFLTTSVRPERGRLTVGTATGTELPVTNGLEWAIESLIVSDQNGQLWFASDLAAGSGRPLQPISDSDRQTFCKLVDRSAPANPEELEHEDDIQSLSTAAFFPYRGIRYTEDFQVSQGQMERTIAALRENVERHQPLSPNTYFAIVKDAPSIEFGTEVDVVDGWHLVIGNY
ncbi:MAG: hypothetical protein HQ518_12700 [Rhodopirellula sp.]|nr:hypothetical protein [Rhodopirellula sp.]